MVVERLIRSRMAPIASLVSWALVVTIRDSIGPFSKRIDSGDFGEDECIRDVRRDEEEEPEYSRRVGRDVAGVLARDGSSSENPEILC